MIEERTVAESFKRGDRAAFEELIDRNQERLYRLAYRITNDAEDALDAVQESFIKIHRSIQDWDGRAAFSSWAYRITTNVAIDIVRRRGRDRKARDGYSQERGSDLEAAPEQPDPFDLDDRSRLVVKVRAAIEELPPGQRAMVALRHYEGLSLAEIAEVRGCALGTVKSTLHQAFAKLRELLKVDLAAVRAL